MTNPTDNQTPQPVDDELEEILSLIQAVKHYPGAHSMKIVGKSEAKARLLQWGTRQVIEARKDELLRFDNDEDTYRLLRLAELRELQASLKDGENQLGEKS